MKQRTIFIALMAIALNGCQTYERIYLSDIDAIVSSHLATNDKMLAEMMNAMKQLKVDTLSRNVNFYARLTTLQRNAVSFCDSLSDFSDRAIAHKRTEAFVDRNIRKKNYTEPEEHFEIYSNTPVSLQRLYVALAVHSLILKKKDQYDMPMLASFNAPGPLIVFDKPMFLRGDTISGRVLFASTMTGHSTQYEVSINGARIPVIGNEGRFALKPERIKGTRKFKLKAKITLGNTDYTAEDSVYMLN